MRGGGKTRLEEAKAKGAWYAERHRDGVTAEVLRNEAGIAGEEMAKILRAQGCELKRERLSLARTRQSGTHSVKPSRREPDFEAMLADARSDHD